MATKTNFLGLTLPGNNEFNDNWDEPTNANFVKIDEEIEEISNELESARFEKTSLAEFLQVGIFSDGTLRPTAEVLGGRNSQVYGSDDGGGNDHTLKIRLDLGDKEIYDAREEAASLIAALARRSQDFDYQDHTISGASDGNGQPNFLTSSAAEFKLDGDPTPVVFNIDGYYMRLDVDESIVVSGGDGTKYLVAKRPATPHENVSKPTEEDGVTTTNVLNNDKVQIFQDSTQDYPLLKLRAGMILQILNTDNAGDYIIDEVAPSANDNQLLIKGEFVNAIGTINYKILDPLRPEFSFETSYSVEKGKCNVGEGEFVASALISSLTYNYKGKFDSQMESIDISTTPTFEKILNHNLGKIPTKIHIFASQADDESEPFEPLSTSVVGNDLDVDISNTLVYTPGVFDPGSGDAGYTVGTLVGDVTGSLTGSVYGLRSVMIKVTKTQIFIKNTRDNHFYRDYDNVDRNQGFLKVVCEK